MTRLKSPIHNLNATTFPLHCRVPSCPSLTTEEEVGSHGYRLFGIQCRPLRIGSVNRSTNRSNRTRKSKICDGTPNGTELPTEEFGQGIELMWRFSCGVSACLRRQLEVGHFSEGSGLSLGTCMWNPSFGAISTAPPWATISIHVHYLHSRNESIIF